MEHAERGNGFVGGEQPEKCTLSRQQAQCSDQRKNRVIVGDRINVLFVARQTNLDTNMSSAQHTQTQNMVKGLDFCPRSQRPRKVNVVNLVQGLGGPLEDCSYSRLMENENVGSLLPGKKKGRVPSG